MFVSVKERARQIASGQFTAPTTTAPVASLIDLAPEPKPKAVATPKQFATKEAPAKAPVSPSKSKLSKGVPAKDATPKVAPPKAAPPPAATPKAAPSKTVAPPPAASTPKKSAPKSKLSKESSSKPPPSPKIGSSKSSTSSKATSQPKLSSPAKATPPKSTSSKAPSTPSKAPSTTSKASSKRAKSPPKRVDSPIEDNDDPLATLKSACLKQVSGVTGLGGRRLAIVLKQRSSGEWYAALKDTGSDKYLKMWMNKDRTFETKEEALEAYLVFATKMRNEVRWFPMSPRASSPKGKGK